MVLVRIGLVGCGNIGSSLLDEFNVVAVYDKDVAKVNNLVNEKGIKVCSSLSELFKCDLDIVVEAASPKAVRDVLLFASRKEVPVVIMSSGGLLDPEVGKLMKKVKLFVPSGAVGGLDLLKASHDCSLRFVMKKPSSAFSGKEGVIFSGKASELVKLYPTKTNVAATLSLALGRDVHVDLIGDPRLTGPEYEIVLDADWGKARIVLDNRPSRNPGTSQLAVNSLKVLLRELESNLKVGT